MTKYFCDRCKKVSDSRPEYVGFRSHGFMERSVHADLCDACFISLLNLFKEFVKGGK